MSKYSLTFFLIIILTSSLNYSQSFLLKANGELTEQNKYPFGGTTYEKNKKDLSKEAIGKKTSKIIGVFDTLSYYWLDAFTLNYGFGGKDALMQFFIAPADLIIKGIGFSCSDDSSTVNGADISVRLVNLNWTPEEMTSLTDEIFMGHYSLAGDYFGENSSGRWIDSSNGTYPLPPWTNHADPDSNTWEYNLRNNKGEWISVVPVKQEFPGRYQWVELDKYDTLNSGSVFAVVIKHNGTNSGDDRISFWAGYSNGYPGWEYYLNGRFQSGNFGWWVSKYTWDFAVAVDFNEGPYYYFSDITSFGATFSKEQVKIEATLKDIHGYGISYIKEINLCYSINGSDYICTPMDSVDNYRISGKIPGQPGGTIVTYYCKAIDLDGGIWESEVYSYKIFKQINKELLVIFNGGSENRANLLAPFYIQEIIPDYDLWAAYGPVESEMLNFYDRVLEIHSEYGGEDDNRISLTSFANRGKKLGVIGQEVLGYLNGYTDSTFSQGDYEYDVLGITNSYNDVNYLLFNNNISPSPVQAVPGTDYGNTLAVWQLKNSIDTIWYDPNYILGSDNSMDLFDPRDDIESQVFMVGFDSDGIEKPVGHSFYNLKNTKIFFMSGDPLVFSSDSGWVGGSSLSPLGQFLVTGCLETGVDDKLLQNKVYLSQNYPNPFNPSTTIKYSIPTSSPLAKGRTEVGFVTLKVYDVLGSEVTTLVNKQQKPGNYEVKFNAGDISSGVYFYQLKAGDYIKTRKMLLLR